MSVQPALTQPIPPGGDWWNLSDAKARRRRNLLLLSIIAVFFVFALANVAFSVDTDGDGDDDLSDCDINDPNKFSPVNMTVLNNTHITFCNGTYRDLSINLSGYNESIKCNGTTFVGMGNSYEGSLFRLLDPTNGIKNLTIQNCFVVNYSMFVDLQFQNENRTREDIWLLNNTLTNMTRRTAAGDGPYGFRLNGNYSHLVIANNYLTTFRQLYSTDWGAGIIVSGSNLGIFMQNASIYGNSVLDFGCSVNRCKMAGIVVQTGNPAGGGNVSVFNNTVGFSRCHDPAGCTLVGIGHVSNGSVNIFNNTIAQLSSSLYAAGILVTSWNGTNITENTFTNISVLDTVYE
ncbi:hypothetical protein HZB03_02370, partial [Candidatus Woesearchaeota archaeon]|nr:hypothetical protein [Candidatus Woesearchaeota archaeon]